MLYAFISLILLVIYYRFPLLSPPVRQLSCFGKPAELLAEAEEELATLPQLATDDMFITEHYFIETSKYGIAIVPIREIIWVYKHSTLHKFFWYHFSISYTLHITANKHLYIHCPKNIKSDIDGIMDYLAEANHDILVGFSEENRLAVQEQGTPLQIEKFLEMLKKEDLGDPLFLGSVSHLLFFYHMLYSIVRISANPVISNTSITLFATLNNIISIFSLLQYFCLFCYIDLHFFLLLNHLRFSFLFFSFFIEYILFLNTLTTAPLHTDCSLRADIPILQSGTM